MYFDPWGFKFERRVLYGYDDFYDETGGFYDDNGWYPFFILIFTGTSAGRSSSKSKN